MIEYLLMGLIALGVLFLVLRPAMPPVYTGLIVLAALILMVVLLSDPAWAWLGVKA